MAYIVFTVLLMSKVAAISFTTLAGALKLGGVARFYAIRVLKSRQLIASACQVFTEVK